MSKLMFNNNKFVQLQEVLVNVMFRKSVLVAPTSFTENCVPKKQIPPLAYLYTDDAIWYGAWVVSVSRRTVGCGLYSRAFISSANAHVLRVLLLHPEEIVTHDELRKVRPIDQHPLSVCVGISSLRGALSEISGGLEPIKTEAGGYRFMHYPNMEPVR